MERRFTVIETTMNEHGRRITDHDDQLKTLQEWKYTIEANTEANREGTETLLKVVEVGENLLVALHWVGEGAKWIIAIGAAFGTVYAGGRWLLKKFGV